MPTARYRRPERFGFRRESSFRRNGVYRSVIDAIVREAVGEAGERVGGGDTVSLASLLSGCLTNAVSSPAWATAITSVSPSPTESRPVVSGASIESSSGGGLAPVESGESLAVLLGDVLTDTDGACRTPCRCRLGRSLTAEAQVPDSVTELSLSDTAGRYRLVL
jgi:hypothetical protein